MSEFEPIEIDLRNLSQEHLAQCKPHLGKCRYDGPCVVGTLMPPAHRASLDDAEYQSTFPEADGPISLLISGGAVVAPADQHRDLMDLQVAFDNWEWDEVEAIASKYIAQAGEVRMDGDAKTGSASEHAVTK